ncbi:AAA-like domain-containing protein [Prosthecobacter fluviatilis]|uniref:AAA-like domain-containing protein n=1 Tax=Prosthecobacter fluviatilis TaxID=445931 RepID=A0ABW0KXD8_9BACT
MSTEPGKQPATARYYWTGGTMPPMNRSYIERRADQELFDAIKAGDFCYVLTSRQMGKSSLVSRAAGSLRSEGFRFGFIDLSGLGKNLTAHQWFDGMLERLGDDFGIEDEIDDFRAANANLGPQQMWQEVIRRVLLAEITGRIVIVIDEIDYVRSITAFSTDELFTGIRELYNRRSRDPELERLSFCLMGVASPADLIENKDITPFNIGHRIELRDFTQQESLALADGLTRLPPDAARDIVSRVYHWTGGQPYLTQKICAMAAADEAATLPAHVDSIVHENFLSQRARETDDNLTAIRDRIDKERTLQPEFTQKLLGVYRRVLKGSRVEDSEVLPEISALKLTGLVRGEKGWLIVKNPIYRENFNTRWISDRMPKDWARMAALWGRAAAVLLLIVCPAVAIWALMQRSKADLARQNAEIILQQTVLEKEAADKSRAEALAASERAKSEATAATQQAAVATDAEKKARSEIAIAKDQQQKAAAAMGQLYKAQTINFWSEGRRTVEAMFFRRAMEDMAAIPQSAKDEVNAAAAELLPDEAAASDEAKAAPALAPAARAATSQVEPAGAFRLSKETPVTSIIPWWHQPGFLVVQQDEDDKRLSQLFAWDLASQPKPEAVAKPSLAFPLSFASVRTDDETSRLVRALDASKDGRRLLVVDGLGLLHVWELQPSVTSLVIKTRRKFASAALLPDGKKIIAAIEDGPVISIELATGVESEPILPPLGEWTALSLSPTGDRFLAGLADGTVVVAGTGPEKAPPVQWKHEGRITALSFLPDGRTCVVASTHEYGRAPETAAVELRDVSTGKPAGAFMLLKEGVESLSVSPDGKRIALGGRLGNAYLLDAATLGEIRKLSIGYSIDEKDIDWGSRIHVSYSKDGASLVACTWSGSIGVWSADGTDVLSDRGSLSFARGPVLTLPSGTIANAGMVDLGETERGDVALFELDPIGRELRYLTTDPESKKDSEASPIPQLTSQGFTAAGFCPPHGIMALSVSARRLYGSYSSLPLTHVAVGYARSFKEMSAWVGDAEFAQGPGPRRALLLTAASFNKPKAQTGKAAASKKGRSQGEDTDQSRTESDGRIFNEAPCCLALSCDGKSLAAGFPSGDVALLDITLPDPSIPDTAGTAGSVFRWRKSFSKSAIKTLSFASHGLLLIAGDDKKYITYKSADGEVESSDDFSGPVVMAPDDLTHLVTKDGGNDGIFLQIAHGTYSIERANSFRSSFPPVTFAFSPEGSWYAAGLKNGSIRLGRDGEVFETIPAFSEKPAQAEAVAFSPDGRCLVAADQHGWLRLWKFFPKPTPIIRAGESLEDAKSRWSVDVSDALSVVGVAREDRSWRDMHADADAARDIADSWHIFAQVTEWYRGGGAHVRREDIDALLARASNTHGKLEKCGMDCQHMQHLEKFKTLLDWKPAATEADQARIDEIETLPAPLRWLLLSTRLKSMELTQPQSREVWQDYAGLIEQRLKMHNIGGIKREALSSEWQGVFDEGVASVKKAVANGALSIRKGQLFYESPQMSEIKARLDKMQKQSSSLSALYEKITEKKGTGVTPQDRTSYLKAYDEAVKSGYPPDYISTARAYIQARALKEYDRATAYLRLTSTLAEEADHKAFAELSWSYLHEELGRPVEALDHVRKATLIPAREDEAWTRRFKLEDKAADLSGDKADLLRCAAEIEKAAGSKKFEEPWRTLFLKVAKHMNDVGRAKETRAFAEQVFKDQPDSLPLYKAFWDGTSSPDEEYRLWSLSVLNQGIEAALKKVKPDSEKEDKDILFHLVSRRAAHYRQQNETLEAAAGYKDAYEHAVDEGNKGWVLTELGDNLRRLGLYTDSEKCFVEGLPNDTSTWAQDAHAELLEDMGLFPEAIAIRKQLFERAEPDSDSIAGITHASAYAGALRLAGRLAEAKAVLQRALAPDSGLTLSKRQSCLHQLALILKREILSPGTAPAQIPALEAEMKKTIDETEALTARMPEAERPANIWLPWLLGDLKETARRIQESAAKDKKPSSTTPYNKAILAALQGDNEEALAQCVVSLSFHLYPDAALFDPPYSQALAALPAMKELVAISAVKNFGDLPLREERLAAWMEALPLTKPENRKTASDIAKALRQRAADMRKAPLSLPEFTKDKPADTARK